MPTKESVSHGQWREGVMSSSEDPNRTKEADAEREAGVGWRPGPASSNTGPGTQVPTTRRALTHFLGSQAFRKIKE